MTESNAQPEKWSDAVQRTYNHVVVGAGALGAAAAYRLAAAGETDILVVEQFELGHGRGASEDHSRIIRHAYHSANYTALTPAAYQTWGEIEDLTGLQLVLRTGGLDLATAETAGEEELHGYRSAMTQVGIASELIGAEEVRARWPQWSIEDDVVGLYQQDGGILDVRRATAAHIALARQLGVEFAPHTAVLGIESTATHVTVQTDAGTVTTGSLVLCAASWLPRLLPDLALSWPITLSQEQVSYFATPHLREFAPERFPMWIWHGESFYYGFPVYGEAAVKIARDMRGAFITQEQRSYTPDPQETKLLSEFLHARLPLAQGPEVYSKTCVYDMPPDRDFILDRAPGHPRVTIGLGAGHAAKFASLVGEILADLATTGETAHPIAAFRADRPALTDPGFVPTFRLS